MLYEKILKYFVLEIISIYVLESALMCELSMISLCEYISLEYSIFIHTNATTYIKLILSLWFFFKISYRLWNSFGGNYCDKCIKKSSCICKNIINVLRYLVTFVKCIEKSSLRWLVTYVTILFPKLFQYRTTFQIIKDLERALHSKRSKDKQIEYEWSTTW